MRRSRYRETGQRGSITLAAVIFMIALTALVGLVIDGGAKFRTARQATAIAEEAARAAAGQVDVGAALAGRTRDNGFTVDQATAIRAAQNYLTTAGQRGTVRAVSPTAIEVTVRIQAPTLFLSAFGVTSLEVSGTARAQLVSGVEEGNRP
ncbi:pilus assembly protein TadG-related protein [Nonomuraea sp. NBC_00507]|uniref:pilus assembly protein TadG-related protein n=1 Tax=Nonomuraea sp. NBC_00507 TaxID=2976002 RepID=UPI002E181DF8